MSAEGIAYRAARRAEDNKPCLRCGGDRLRPDFRSIDRCCVPFAEQP